MEDLKKLERSLYVEDFVEDMDNSLKYGQTLGTVWERCIGCDTCKYRETCEATADRLEELGVKIKCSQFIDLLLGETTVEKIMRGDNK
jgi:hypothetical protein